jgi:hypothetical protein
VRLPIREVLDGRRLLSFLIHVERKYRELCLQPDPYVGWECMCMPLWHSVEWQRVLPSVCALGWHAMCLPHWKVLHGHGMLRV